MLRSSSTRHYLNRVRGENPRLGFVPLMDRHPVECKSAHEAVSHIKSNDRVFIHCCASCPQSLVNALAERAPELENIEITSSLMSHTDPFFADNPITRKAFSPNLFYVCPEARSAMKKSVPHCRYIPMLLRDVPSALRANHFPIDAALLLVSPPDKHGFCSLGPSVTVAKAGACSAKIVIAEISKHVPRVFGNTFLHMSHFDYVYQSDRKLPQFKPTEPNEVHNKIGRYIAEMVNDGDCLQMGIGGVPDSVLRSLRNHKNLGIHTEMFAEGAIDLIKRGVVNNSKKVIKPGKVVANFVMGTDNLYNCIDNNPMFYFDSAEWTNDPYVICQNPNMKAINSAIEVDLTGQVCADSIGVHEISGVGGQNDFVRGASMSEGGRAFIALPSTAKSGSRIVKCLKDGASVTTSRFDGVTIVTEYGIADLWGMTTRERAQAMINIAHPKYREQLAKDASEIFGGHFQY